MPRDFPRTRRVGEQLQRELATLIRDEVRDPRVGMVSVSAVEVSRDLSHAKVFVSTLGEKEETTELLKVLEGAAGYLRHLLGQSLNMRHVPQLQFKHDHSLQEGARLSALIDSAVEADAKHDDDTDQDT
ncbi:Ribosome-binding factor A [hydrothermal vent metagenome]|uniref:Ribosome-binding factor A n=1 Tax=hydrothermal vent metagenome TaxID=652676 RepID=A0A3B0Z5F8_9ZZZZ